MLAAGGRREPGLTDAATTIDSVIERYSRPAMKAIWSDEGRLARWLEVELAALEGWGTLGAVPVEAVEEIRAARARLESVVRPTPSFFSHSLSALLGHEVWLVTHARTRHGWPTCAESSAMRTNEAGGMSLVSCEWRGARATPRIPSGRASRCGLDRSASRAEPTTVYARQRGSKGLDGGHFAPRLNTSTHSLCT